MSKYDISVNVKSTTSGRAGGQIEMSRASIRERMQQSQTLKETLRTQTGRGPNLKGDVLLNKNLSLLNQNLLKVNSSISNIGKSFISQRQAVKPESRIKPDILQKQEITRNKERDPSLKTNQNLHQSINKLDKGILKLNESVLKLNSTQSRVSGGGRGVGAGGLPTSGGGLGGGAGGIGAAAGAIGIPIAAFGYALSKVMQVGQANIAARMEQRGTYGISGFQRSGMQLDVMSASDYGQYLKAQRMQTGSFTTGKGAYTESENVTKSGKMSFREMAMYGTSAEEMGRRVGSMNLLTGRSGEDEYNKVVSNLYRKEGGQVISLGTAEPAIMQAIADRMQEAITTGVKDADLAADMAKEFTAYSKAAGPGYTRFALQNQQSVMDVQKDITSGGVGGVSGLMMRQITEEMVRTKGSEARKKLIESGRFTEKDFNNMNSSKMETAIQYLNANAGGDIRGEYNRKLVKQFGGQGYDAFREVYQGVISKGATESQARAAWDIGNSEPIAKVDPEDVVKMQNKEGFLAGNPVSAAILGTNKTEKLKFSEAGMATGNTFLKLNEEMIGFANSMSGPVDTGLKGFLSSIEAASKGLSGLAGFFSTDENKKSGWSIGTIIRDFKETYGFGDSEPVLKTNKGVR